MWLSLPGVDVGNLGHVFRVFRLQLQSEDPENMPKMLQSEYPENMPKITHINPREGQPHFFPMWQQSDNMPAAENKLKETGIEYVNDSVEEVGIYVDQLFFHDPDGFMIKICNCNNIP